MSITVEDVMCRVCGCTDDDCANCIRRTGEPCQWIEPDLCSACCSPAVRSDGVAVLMIELHPKAAGMIVTIADFGLWGATAKQVAEGAVYKHLRNLFRDGWISEPEPDLAKKTKGSTKEDMKGSKKEGSRG